MTVSSGLGDDAQYLDVTARVFGWQAVWDPGRGSACMTRGPWVLRVLFWPAGDFRCAEVHGPHEASALGLAQVVALLEREGSVTRPAA